MTLAARLMADLSAPFAELAEALDDRLPPRLRGLAEVGPDPAHLPARGRVILRLDPAAALWREIDLPQTPPDRRDAAIAARLEELSPWAPGAYLWAEAPGDGVRLRLALTAAEPVRALEAAVRARGGQLVELRIGAARRRMGDPGPRLRRAVAVWALVMALALALSALALWRSSTATAAADLAQIRLTRFLQDTALQGDRSKAILGRAAQVPASRLGPRLDLLAASLPLDSYLLTLRLTPADFQIAGQSATPDAIVPALEAAGFRAVDFAGASALDSATGLYSFTIAGQAGGTK